MSAQFQKWVILLLNVQWIAEDRISGELNASASDEHLSVDLDWNSILVIREMCSDRVLAIK